MLNINNTTLLIVIFNVFLYATAYLLYSKYYRKSLLGKYLLLLYLISSISGLLFFIRSREYTNITLLPYIYLFTCVIIACLPILKYKDRVLQEIRIPHTSRMNLFLLPLVILSFLDLILYFDLYTKGIIFALSDHSDVFADIYKERIYANESKTSLNYTNLLHVIFGSFFNLLPFLFFYYHTIKDGSIFIKWGLGLSLFLPLLSTISNAGRNGLIVFLLLLFSSYILFKNFYTIRKKKIISLIIVILTSSIVSVIITISIARFANREGDNPVLDSLISYSGQSSLNFNEYIFTAKSHELGDNSFPLIRMFLGLEYSTSPIIRQLKWESKMGIPLHVFYTFVGDFCLDFGPFIAFFFIVIISLFVSNNISYNNRGSTKLHDIFLIYFVFNSCAQGVFYFMDKTIGGNLSILTFILVYILIKHFLFTSNGKSISILSSTISSNSRK